MTQVSEKKTWELTTREGTILSDKLSDLLMKQYLHECSNAHVYAAFASWARIKGYPAASKWFLHQKKEEEKHADAIYEFLTDCGIHFFLDEILINQQEITGYKSLFRMALSLEVETTDNINGIVHQAGLEKSYLVQDFLVKLLSAQKEEEEEARTRYMICENGSDLLLVDNVINSL